jgi:CheY-like chemotaxis protein
MSKLLLIVDDDAASREAVDLYLRRSGFRTRLAADGLEALGLVGAERPDLILLDLAMPRVDGLMFLRTLRQIPPLADIPVVVMTSRSDLEASQGAKDSGVASYLVKTRYTLKELLAVVRRQCDEPPAA